MPIALFTVNQLDCGQWVVLTVNEDGQEVLIGPVSWRSYATATEARGAAEAAGAVDTNRALPWEEIA